MIEKPLPEAASRSRGLHVPASSGTHTWLSGDAYTIKIDSEASGGSLTVLEASVPPGAGPPLHRHADADEAFYLLAGELEVTVDGATHHAGPGDFVFVPRETPHRFRNPGLHTARQLLLFTPSGVEGFFVEAGQRPTPGLPPPLPQDEDSEAVARIGERYHLFQAE